MQSLNSVCTSKVFGVGVLDGSITYAHPWYGQTDTLSLMHTQYQRETETVMRSSGSHQIKAFTVLFLVHLLRKNNSFISFSIPLSSPSSPFTFSPALDLWPGDMLYWCSIVVCVQWLFGRITCIWAILPCRRSLCLLLR